MTDIETERKLTEEHILLYRNKGSGTGILPQPNCEICHPIKGPKTRTDPIGTFFGEYKRIFPEAITYNQNTKEEYSKLRGNLISRRKLQSPEKLKKLDEKTHEHAANVVLTIRYNRAPKYPADQLAYAVIRTVYNTAAFTKGNSQKEFLTAINIYKKIYCKPWTKTQRESQLRTELYTLSDQDAEEAERSFVSPVNLSPRIKEFPSTKTPSPILSATTGPEISTPDPGTTPNVQKALETLQELVKEISAIPSVQTPESGKGKARETEEQALERQRQKELEEEAEKQWENFTATYQSSREFQELDPEEQELTNSIVAQFRAENPTLIPEEQTQDISTTDPQVEANIPEEPTSHQTESEEQTPPLIEQEQGQPQVQEQ